MLSVQDLTEFLAQDLIKKETILEYLENRPLFNLKYSTLKILLQHYDISDNELLRLLKNKVNISYNYAKILVRLLIENNKDITNIVKTYPNLRKKLLKAYIKIQEAQDEDYLLPDQFLSDAIKYDYKPSIVKFIYKNSIGSSKNRTLYKKYLADRNLERSNSDSEHTQETDESSEGSEGSDNNSNNDDSSDNSSDSSSGSE